MFQKICIKNILTSEAFFSPSSFAALVLTVSSLFLGMFLLLPDEFIVGTSSYWLSENSDITQYISGFNAFFDSQWQWPLLAFDSFNYPVGTRATFVDIIPIYSVILKLIVPNDFFPFNPFGYWIALCYLLQGVGAWWILKELKFNSWVALIAITTIFVLSPALMARLGHISLMSHWLILFSFALYIRSSRLGFLQYKSNLVLLFFAFYINVYLFAMIFSIYLATVFHLSRNYKIREVVFFILSPILLNITSMLITLLPFSSSGVVGDGGFGLYSMNILSPILGGDLLNIHAATMPGQGEGFNYLGLGVLVLFFLACVLDARTGFNSLRKHKVMVALLLLFFAYALSSKVYFGTTQVASIPYPNFMDSLTSQFRASGRFFWPVGYAITIYSLGVISKHYRQHMLLIASTILFVTVLHVYDLKGRMSVFNDVASQDSITILEPSELEAATGVGIREFYFYPKFRCPTKSSPHETLLPLMRYSSERGIKLNTGYIARYQASCSDIELEISSAINKSSVFVFTYDDYPNVENINKLFPDDSNLVCTLLSKMYICRVESRQ